MTEALALAIESMTTATKMTFALAVVIAGLDPAIQDCAVAAAPVDRRVAPGDDELYGNHGLFSKAFIETDTDTSTAAEAPAA